MILEADRIDTNRDGSVLSSSTGRVCRVKGVIFKDLKAEMSVTEGDQTESHSDARNCAFNQTTG